VIYATQSTGASQPTYQVDGNGRGHLSFDGTSDFMVTPAIASVANYQAFGAVYPTSVTGVRFVMDEDYPSVGTRRAQYLRINGANPETIAFVGGTPFTDVGPSVTINTATVLASIAISGTSVDVRTGGASNGTATVTGAINTANQAVHIGRYSNSAQEFFSGRIYGLVLRYGPNLTTQQITDTEAWAAALMNP
jgi:hypothetical protein